MDQAAYHAEQLEIQHELARIYEFILAMNKTISHFGKAEPLTEDDLALIRLAFGIKQQ